MSSGHDNTSVGESKTVDKLPYETEHHAALQRMCLLREYYRWTYGLISPYLGKRVLDAGCGIGNFTELVVPSAEYVLAADLSPQNCNILRQRFVDCEHVEVAQIDLDSDLTQFSHLHLDTVICLDVLEHIECDVSLLERFAELSTSSAHLLVKVPACQWMYGAVDVASGHYRRYSRRELCDKARAAGWNPIRTTYMNAWGVLPYYLKSRVLKRNANFSQTFSPWQLSLIRLMVPALRRLDRLIGPPVGQSLVLVASRKAE